MADEPDYTIEDCPLCDGTGKVLKIKCRLCRGTGKVKMPK